MGSRSVGGASRASTRVSARRREELKQDIPSLGPRYELAQRSKVLTLSCLSLDMVPNDIWTLTQLVRLDLGCNDLETLSPSVRELTSLEQLWLNDNPLREIPREMEHCKRLRVLDVRGTRLAALPMELGRLKRLVEIDVTKTPYAVELAAAGAACFYRTPDDTAQLMEALDVEDKRETLRLAMYEKSCAGVYRESSGTEDDRAKVALLVRAVCDEFADLAELRNVVRNCDRLLPADLDAAVCSVGAVQRAAAKLRSEFTLMRRDNDKKRLSADLELKMRALYYDNIDPRKVEGYIKAIYEVTTEAPAANNNAAAAPVVNTGKPPRGLDLEDLNFLIKHAPRLFPANPEEITGRGMRAAVWKLQEDLTVDRANCCADVAAALRNIYPDAEPRAVLDLTKRVCTLFERDRFATKKELVELKKLAADAAALFPPELRAADPAAIRAAFRAREHQTASLANSASRRPSSHAGSIA